MRFTLILTLALLAAGCSTARFSAEYNEMRANPREYFNLLSPTLATDARVDGQSVTLKRGQALVIRLDEDPSQGERWQMQPVSTSTISAPVQHDFVARGGTEPNAPGPGDAVFHLRGITPGTQQVVLEFKRPYESVVSKTIRFDVVVR